MLYHKYYYCPFTVNSAILSDPPRLVTASEWTQVEIHCTASGSPIPNVTWEKVGGGTPPTAVNTINHSQNRVSGANLMHVWLLICKCMVYNYVLAVYY